MNVYRSLITTCALASIVGCSNSGGESDGGTDPATTTPATTQSSHATPSDTDPTTPVAPAVPPTMNFTLASNGLPESGMWKSDPHFADVNRDGHMDVAAIVRLGNGPGVWLGNGRGEWTNSSEGLRRKTDSCGGGVDFGDVNGDGHLDLLVADHCSGVFVYLGDGNGKWNEVVSELYPADILQPDGGVNMVRGAEDITSGDFNGDGHLDLAAGASDEGGINVYFGDGTGVNWERAISGLPEIGWATRLQARDMNKDGHLDIVAAYDEGPRVWINDGQGNFDWGSTGLPTPGVRGIYTGVDVADINEDGLMDIAIANWIDGPEAYLQDTDGYWTKADTVFPEMEGGAIGLAMGRIDRDQHVDMVVSGRIDLAAGLVRGVYALRGDGRGGFTYMEGSGLPATGLLATPGVALGDVDGDNVLDVAACTGLLVETNMGMADPVVKQRVMVWRTTLPPGPRAASSAGASDIDR